MTDDITIALLSILGTAIGVFLGFGLTKFNDIKTAKRERQRNQNLLRFKSNSIKEMIDTIIKQVNKSEKIADLESLIIIEDFLLNNDIKEEISKLESIMDKIVKSDYDDKDRLYLSIILRIKASINYLLYLKTIHIHEPDDEKPSLIEILTTTSKDLDYLSQIQ
ncbi:hypothetical protein [uncultured Methanoregula sp.]|uniref:hypothetical protein n=1 Tax=uncultured Methanoregula sp. TaxID=1005933 RepID=UPI002AAB1EC0|nr:hypothetical protein [uncultured Methanoregula sp.]